MKDLKEALESIHNVIVFSPKNWASENRNAWIYGVVCGWGDESYKEFRKSFGWTEIDVQRNKQLHNAYKSAMKFTE